MIDDQPAGPPINYGRVALGGLVAGVVANICDNISNGILLTDDMNRMTSRLNLDPDVVSSQGVFVTWVVVDFIYAFLIVWTYAAVRPRLGPGPKTAIIAGLILWGAITAVLLGYQQMGVFTFDSFLKSAGLLALSTILASLAGGAVYKE